MQRERQFKFRKVTPAGMDGELWDVSIQPDDLSYRVTGTGTRLNSTPRGTAPIGRAWTDDEIENGIRWAIERDLVSTVGVKPGERREINLTEFDLYEANGKG